MAQNVLITGSSSGFGNLTVSTLLKAGYEVVASMRDPTGRNRAAADDLNSEGAVIVDIDVTVDSSVESGVTEAIERVGRIDVLVNNAGVGVTGLQECFTIDDWKELFDLNLYGAQRMNRAILPHFREKGSGLLVHVSSMLARLVLPFMAPYSASKAALEAMSEGYRVELSNLGIESIIVEPGAFGTPFHSNRFKSSDADRIAAYGEYGRQPELRAAEMAKQLKEEGAPDPRMVADAILKLIETPRGKRPFRTTVDGLGVAAPIDSYNEAADGMTNGVYQAIGISEMLKVK